MQLPRTHLKPRKLAGLVAGAGLVLTTLLGAAPAQAADSAPQAVSSTEQQVGTHADAGVLANSPGISPAAERIRYVSGDTYSCPTGRLCARVWDPTRSTYKVFDLYYCNTYSLSYWGGLGGFYNYQTEGTVARFYNSGGTTVHTSTARSTAPSGWNWDPIWKIKNC
ncbi:hypothetical protein RB628_11425 [Streptomyces sp. ADMS]|uniref:hypothetical protein n=1 Tax=Streptomyces sp. ADMS TaxID=3071415 RepID=UPI00296FC635|nr:hypothetical protein [Streptomyces sp. ADMS]MDW4905926.1 hypothetical protein [Streptomyces sp. ADMS]